MNKMSTCYNEDDEYNKKNKNVVYYDKEKDMYTLIWYDCPKCKELLETLKQWNIPYIYINGGEYFYDISDEKSEFNTPLFYKDDEFIGDNLFDIYSELHKTV
jgi:glutaredoxin